MSHFCVYVFHDADTSVGDLLAPYDENIKLKTPVIEYTREQLVGKVRKDIENTRKSYEEYLADPKGFEEKHSFNGRYIDYLKNKFPKKLNWTDEECYESEAGYYREDGLVDEDGNIITTYNPDSKWDWYEIGGRWSGTIGSRNEMKVSDVNVDEISTPYAFVTPSGEWVERGSMGWWGLSSGDMDKDEWDDKVRDYMKSLDENIVLTQVDCHI